MFKLIMVAVVLGFLLSTATAFSEVETYEDAIPVLETIGQNLYQTLTTSVEFTQEIIDIWSVENV